MSPITHEQLMEPHVAERFTATCHSVPTAESPAMHRLLVATDASPASDGALRIADLLAARLGARVQVLSVLEGRTDGNGGLLADRLMEDVERRFGRVRSQIRGVLGVQPDWQGIIDTGPIVETICRVADAGVGSDLIVVGFGRHRRAADRAPEKATVQLIPEMSATPMLVVPAHAHALPARAMLAVDFSRASIRAGRAALQVMGADGVLHLVYVHASNAPFPMEPPDAASSYAAGFATFFEAVEHELDPPAGVSFVRAVVRCGDPVNELLTYANEHEIELIAMGKHAKATHERFHLGSVSSGILRSAQCAVLVSGNCDREVTP